MTKLNAKVITELLKIKHEGPQWARFVELNQGTGGRMGRRIDFYAMNVWPSNGYHRVAYEIKLSRADYTNEINDPTKREFAEKVANECYFVTPPGLVRPDELPEWWGLYEVVANGLRRKVIGKQRKVEDPPLAFVASLARCSSEDNSKLPKELWLMNGQELDLEGLELAVTAAQEKIIERKVRNVEMDLEKEQREFVRRHQLFKSAIIKHIGYEYSDPERFSEWLKSNRAELPANVKRSLRNLQREVGALLND
jgi:hypothetical protein